MDIGVNHRYVVKVIEIKSAEVLLVKLSFVCVSIPLSFFLSFFLCEILYDLIGTLQVEKESQYNYFQCLFRV